MPTNTIAMQTSPANEFAPDQISIQRRLQMAKMLQDQAMAPTEQQVVSGRVVPISPWQGAARLAQALAGNRMQSGAEEQTRTANQAYSQRLAETLQAFGQEQDPQKKASILMAHPATQSAGMKLIEQMGQPRKPLVVGRTLMDETGKQLGVDSTWQAEQQAAREAKKSELEARLADQRISREESAALRRELAANASADRRALAGIVHSGQNKPPAGYRVTAEGNLEAIPGGPADVKAQAVAQRQADGATDVDVALGTLRDAYSRLESGGGITSTKNGPLSNAAASIASSSIGQGAGKLLGTQNQSARNDIAMARPALLAALMKATGMSAKQMDSNAELKLWLSTATDPTLDVESNRRALQNIERKYIKPVDAKAAPAAPSAVGGGGSNVDALLKKYGG